MKVLIFGATGMVGQGVVKECLNAPDVESVVTVGRSVLKAAHPKLRQIVHQDMTNYSAVESQLTGFDACFFSMGVTSSGMTELEYDRVTCGLTLAAARTLSQLNPQMTFIYVSGAGTDTTEQGRIMWARVKGRTENELLRLPLKAYMFRPGLIQPRDGIRSRTPLYRFMYLAMSPVLPILHWLLPNHISSTREIGQAMLAVARHGFRKHILETRHIRAVLKG